MNLAATVNVVLYDRLAKAEYPLWAQVQIKLPLSAPSERG